MVEDVSAPRARDVSTRSKAGSAVQGHTRANRKSHAIIPWWEGDTLLQKEKLTELKNPILSRQKRK